MATFLCGGCGYEKLTSDKHIGRTTKCPKCSQSSVVQAVVESPSAWDVGEEPSEPPEQPSAAIQVMPVKKMPMWATIVMVLTWGSLGVVILLGIISYIMAAASSENPMQQSAVTAGLVIRLITGYIIARCVEKIVKAVAQR